MFSICIWLGKYFLNILCLVTISLCPLRTPLVGSPILLHKTQNILTLSIVSTEYTIRDCRQITLVTINGFCPLSSENGFSSH